MKTPKLRTRKKTKISESRKLKLGIRKRLLDGFLDILPYMVNDEYKNYKRLGLVYEKNKEKNKKKEKR